MKIKTGNGVITLTALIAIYSVSVVTSLPGLAIAPILGKLETVFKSASELQLQLLESLPSFIIIPFILLSGQLSVNRDKRKILIYSLGIFLASSILFLFANNMTFLLINSCILGIGAGMVIPLSTGLVADFFSGTARTRQLGIVSGIANISLVMATLLAGFLAGINWRSAFLVYCISIVSFVFAFFLQKPPKPSQDDSPAQKIIKVAGLQIDWPFGLMVFYFFMTLTVLIVPFNLSLYMKEMKIGNSDISGTLISFFFLAITIPGFFITPILRFGKKNTNFLALGLVTLGLALFLITKSDILLTLGVVLIGFGYGVIQPIIYDKTSERVRPERVTLAMAFVMSMNYIAIVVYPFFTKLIGLLAGSDSTLAPFVVTLCIAGTMTLIAYLKRDTTVIGMKYYAALAGDKK